MAKKSNSKSGKSRDLSIGGFLFRFAAASFLVLATYNPSDISFVDWVQGGIANGTISAANVFVGVVLLIGWTIFIVASIRALGTLGIILGVAFFAALIWLLIDFGILSANSATSVTWIALFCLSGLLAIGVSWAHVWRKVTGQLEVNDDD